MRSLEWFKTRGARAERRLQRDRAKGLSLGTVLAALREFTDDSFTEEVARDAAPVFGCLTLNEYRHLLSEARSQVARELDYVFELADDLSRKLDPTGEKTLEQVRMKADDNGMVGIVPFAVSLQALAWAIRLPDEPHKTITY